MAPKVVPMVVSTLASTVLWPRLMIVVKLAVVTALTFIEAIWALK